jgi:hypothetical protein
VKDIFYDIAGGPQDEAANTANAVKDNAGITRHIQV